MYPLESPSKANHLHRFIKKYVKPNEVQNNKLELATFVRSFLKLFQFWIDGEISFWRWALGYFIYFLSHGILLMALANFIRYAIKSDEFYMDDVISDLVLIVALLLSFHIFREFYAPQKQWAALLMELGNFEEYEKPEGIELADAVADARLKWSLYLFYVPIPFFIYYFFSAECNNPEDTKCGFVLPFYFPGCMGRLRPLCAIIHLGSAYSLTTIINVVANLYTHMVEYIVCYLMHFQRMLKKIPLIDDWDERWIFVKKTIKYHQRILELYKWYFKLVKNVFFTHAFGTPIIMALLIYNTMIDFRIRDLSHSFTFLVFFSLFVVCYFGQRMIDESEAVTLAAYESIPFDGDIKTAKALLFLLQRSQKTLHIPVGSLTFCGYDLCVTVMKTMYSYLTLINSRRSVEAK